MNFITSILNNLIFLWAAFSLLNFLVLWCLADDDGEHAGKLIVLTILLLAFFGSRLEPLYQQLTWRWLVGLGFAYCFVGAVWSVFKWGQYLRYKIPSLYSRHSNDGVVDAASEKRVRESTEISPEFQKERIVSWIAWWPWSMLNFGLKLVFRDLFRSIAEVCNSIYQRLTSQALKRYQPK
jgi:hypothetical protein